MTAITFEVCEPLLAQASSMWQILHSHLLPVNEYFTTLDWPFNFFFVFFILKVMFFVNLSLCNDLKINN